MAEIVVRDEAPGDHARVRAVVEAAFGRAAEADLVDAIRTNGNAVISLVAEGPGGVAGHVLFSPVTVEGSDARVLGLAPVAVAPGAQRQGAGGALIRAGLARAEALGFAGVVLIGHPAYYPRFGFVPASRFGLRSEYGVPDEVFMAIALRPGALAGVRGLVRYGAEFAGV